MDGVEDFKLVSPSERNSVPSLLSRPIPSIHPSAFRIGGELLIVLLLVPALFETELCFL